VTLAHVGHAAGGTEVLGWVLVASIVLVPALAYARAVRSRHAGGRPWPAGRTACFVLGLALAAVALSPAMAAAAHDGPRGHMVQHLLLGMFAPLALVLAAPATLLLAALPPGGRRRVAAVLRSRALHVLAHPGTAAVLDVGGLYVLYLTPLYAVVAGNTVVHQLVGVHFLLAGYLFSWSIAGPDPAPRRPGLAVRVAVLIGAGTAHGHLAKLLYARAGELPPGSTAELDEVQAAAQLMYYGGDLAEVALAVALFAAWNRRRAGRRLRRACGSASAAPARRPSSGPTSGPVPSSAPAPAPPRSSRPTCPPAPPPRWPAAR
jgi:putative membrane protein